MTEAGAGLSAASLLAEAEARAGLSDWGDTAFVETLELLVSSCRSTARLTPMGWTVLGKVAVRHLRNRLSLQAHVNQHPEVLDRPIGRPLVITGLPRTGTTLLHNLLALDPTHRVLRLWEALRPVPADPASGVSEETLVEQAESWLEQLYRLTPEFRAIHGGTPRGPEECDALLQNSFASQHFDDMFDGREYSAWLARADLSREYEHYVLQLRALTRPSDAERRWVLKSPSHLGHLDALLGALPDCVVVHCHRDPCEAVSSYASLISAVRRPYTEELSAPVVGEQALSRSAVAMDRALGVRDTRPGVFLDVSYAQLVSDPIALVRQIYDSLRTPLGDDVESAMRGWLAENRQHRHGVHRHSLEQFGLQPDQVTAAFSPYLERFAAVAAS